MVRLQSKSYKAARRALDWLNGGSYTQNQWKDCLDFFNNRCAYTGDILTQVNIHCDHIVPVSKDGTSFIWNMCPSVDYANLSKNNKDLEEWYKEQPYFSKERLEKIYSWIDYAKFMYQEEYE